MKDMGLIKDGLGLKEMDWGPTVLAKEYDIVHNKRNRSLVPDLNFNRNNGIVFGGTSDSKLGKKTEYLSKQKRPREIILEAQKQKKNVK